MWTRTPVSVSISISALDEGWCWRRGLVVFGRAVGRVAVGQKQWPAWVRAVRRMVGHSKAREMSGLASVEWQAQPISGSCVIGIWIPLVFDASADPGI